MARFRRSSKIGAFKMRLFGRILGAFLALCGGAILAIFLYELVSEGWPSEYGAATAGAVLLVGFGLVFAGWYYFRMDLEASVEAKPTSNFTRFLVSHRYQLKVLSQTGTVLSLIAFIATYFDYELTKRAWLPLLIGALVLNSFTRRVANPEIADNRDWMRVPGWIRRAMTGIEKALKVAWILPVGLVFVNQWLLHSALSGRSAYRVAVLLFLYAMPASMYALQALFFQYGDLRDESDVTAT